MTHDDAPYDPAALPTPVLAYLDAQDHGHHEEARRLFAPDATVHDDGITYRGAQEVGAWLEGPSREFEYTSTRLTQHVSGPDHATVRIRLDGTFPGGTVTLRYRFALEDGRITRLSIEV